MKFCKNYIFNLFLFTSILSYTIIFNNKINSIFGILEIFFFIILLHFILIFISESFAFLINKFIKFFKYHSLSTSLLVFPAAYLFFLDKKSSGLIVINSYNIKIILISIILSLILYFIFQILFKFINKTHISVILISIFLFLYIFNNLFYNYKKPEISIKPNSNKLMLIGIDGLDLDFILKNSDNLHFFKNLLKNNFHSKLNTLQCGLSQPVWNTIYSGKSPAKTGIEDWLYYELPLSNIKLKIIPEYLRKIFQKIESLQILDSNLFSSVDRWSLHIGEILSYYKIHSALINNWTTYPIFKINGVVIPFRSNLAYSKSDNILQKFDDFKKEHSVYPKNILNFIQKISVNSKKNAVKQSQNFFDNNYKKIKQLMHSLTLDYLTLNELEFILNNYSSNFVSVYFNGLDPVCHHFWYYYDYNYYKSSINKNEYQIYKNTVLSYYQLMEKFLEKIFNKYSDYSFIIVSDHGFTSGPYGGRHSGFRDKNTKVNGTIFIKLNPNHKIKIKNNISINVQDLAPSILNFFNMNLPNDMDGKTIFQNNNLKKIKSYEFIELIPAYKNSETNKNQTILKNQLKSLGYFN